MASDNASSKNPFAWPSTSRKEWQDLMTHRRHARLYLIASWAPYVPSAAAAGIGLTGRHDSDHAVWIGVGGILFCIFVFAAPFYLPICLREWWQERKEVLALRNAFWRKYLEDPFELRVPPEPQEQPTPWE